MRGNERETLPLSSSCILSIQSFNNTLLNVAKPVWREYPKLNQPAPECHSPAYTRENHLGDVRGSEMAVFNWTVPRTISNKCLLRIRCVR